MGVMNLKQTHTYAELELSQAAYDEIATKLKDAGYDHAFMDDGAIDMHGIGVTREENSEGAQRTPEREALEDIWALTASFSHYTLEHFARKVRSKVDAALASQPPAAPVETKPDWCQGADAICHHPACACVLPDDQCSAESANLRTFDTAGTVFRRVGKVLTITCDSDAIANRVADQLRTEPQGVPQRDPIVAAVASLAAAISLLERTPKAKKAAPSDKMFDQMLADYRKALAEASAAVEAAIQPQTTVVTDWEDVAQRTNVGTWCDACQTTHWSGQCDPDLDQQRGL